MMVDFKRKSKLLHSFESRSLQIQPSPVYVVSGFIHINSGLQGNNEVFRIAVQYDLSTTMVSI